MVKAVNWGIMGPGQMARSFSKALRAIPNARLLAVGSTSKERARLFAEELSVPRTYGNYKEFLDDKEIDVVYISTIHTKHYECVLEALIAGKAVLCEKPLGMNYSEVVQMAESSTSKNLLLMEGLWTRFLPAYKQVKRWVADRKIGHIKRITADFSYFTETDPKSRVYSAALGGGALLDVGIYILGLAVDFLGTEPRNIKCCGHIGATGVDETVGITLDYGNGTLANLYCSVKAKMPQDAYKYGIEGYIYLPEFWRSSSAYLYKDGKILDSIEDSKNGSGYQYEAEAVMNCLQSGLTTCSVMSLKDSLLLTKMRDEILKELITNSRN